MGFFIDPSACQQAARIAFVSRVMRTRSFVSLFFLSLVGGKRLGLVVDPIDFFPTARIYDVCGSRSSSGVFFCDPGRRGGGFEFPRARSRLVPCRDASDVSQGGNASTTLFFPSFFFVFVFRFVSYRFPTIDSQSKSFTNLCQSQTRARVWLPGSQVDQGQVLVPPAKAKRESLGRQVTGRQGR